MKLSARESVLLSVCCLAISLYSWLNGDLPTAITGVVLAIATMVWSWLKTRRNQHDLKLRNATSSAGDRSKVPAVN